MSVATDARPRRGRFTAQDVARARELRAAGWTYARISELFTAEFGRTVHRRTVQLWCNPQAAEAHRRNDRKAKIRARADSYVVSVPGDRSREWKLMRMVALSRAGVTPRGIAAVMSVDFPGDPVLSKHQVSYALEKAGETGVSS